MVTSRSLYALAFFFGGFSFDAAVVYGILRNEKLAGVWDLEESESLLFIYHFNYLLICLLCYGSCMYLIIMVIM